MGESNQSIPIYERLIQEKDKVIQEKDKVIPEKDKSAQEKEILLKFDRSLIAEKDKSIDAIKGQSDAEIRLLTDKLKPSNMDILRISGSLCVRGMIEKIELEQSDARRSDSSASRVRVWNEILDLNPNLLRGMPGHSDPSRRGNFTASVTEIFRKCSVEVHDYGLDEIPIQTHLFNGNEILVLEAVCTVFHYAFKMV